MSLELSHNHNHDTWWQAIKTRNPDFETGFVYGVMTTGVFCRPTCPSRQPKYENIRFFSDMAEAKKAGFRACKRCKPEALSLRSQHEIIILGLCHDLEQSEREPSLKLMAQKVGLSPYYLQRLFKSVIGLSPKVYAKAHKLKRLSDTLSPDKTVTEAIYEAGFSSANSFYARAHQSHGMRPKEIRHGAKGEVIRFAVEACSLGQVLVAQSEKGVCAVLLGDETEALISELKARFPKADLKGAEPDFEAVIALGIAVVEGQTTAKGLSLDIRGTVFQYKVWEALLKTNVGERLSYGELAQIIGQPKAVRAVASACAANALAVIIPCHRVVRSTGDLSGYRWGLARKEALLEREQKEN
jgi:AraC family transcriptional regulator, regulatory protein of adaptative response / methylated-DNA-[protein]-cysteine methyltransferase